jgi:hypothetical protein
MPPERQSWSLDIDSVPDGVRLTRARTARLADTSVSTVDRARRSGTLEWHQWNRRGVRIWSQDARAWIVRGCPVILLIAALGYALITFAFGCSPTRPIQKHKHHHHETQGVLVEKAPRGGVRWKVKRR